MLNNKQEVKSMLSDEKEKSDFLFYRLTRVYVRIYHHHHSAIGRLARLVQQLYLVLTLRWSAKTNQQLIYEEAVSFIEEHKIDLAEFSPLPSRFSLIKQVIFYTIKHPYSSYRLLSAYRIKKLVKMIWEGPASSSAVAWIEGRFPLDTDQWDTPIILNIDDEEEAYSFSFLKHHNIDVSIVVPVYNQYKTTLSCLLAIKEHTVGINYEVIIADDCSSDLTQSIGQRISNIVVVRNENNLGFLKNCNNAVTKAKGEFIVLLNNDTNVQENWLTELLSVFQNQQDVGLVGPKLLFEDGALQEAGGIIWQDGTGWNYGRGSNPSSPEYNYLKEVDYISGACITFKRSLWEELGGFDERFCPAYYEDSDFAFQVRQAGYKVLYQPFSIVVHMEGVSNGSDLNSGIKKHQQINQDVFYKKWKNILKEENFKSGDSVFEARDRSSKKTTVLIIDHYVPFYDKDAGSRSTFLYIKAMLNLGINVKFLGANFFPHEPYTEVLQSMGVEVFYGERYAKNWKVWLQDNSKYIDVIYLHRPHITEDFIEEIIELKERPKLIYFGHDLHYIRADRASEIEKSEALKKESEMWKSREFTIFSKVDKVYYPSQVEVDAIKKINPEIDVNAIPLYMIDTPNIRVYKHNDRSGLIFVGGFGHPPNLDAVKWFVSEVFPLVLAEIPDIIFHIVGSNAPEEVIALENTNIKVHGYLSDEDLAALYKTVRICVVPLRYGAGVKGKLLEAVQQSLPIVTTPVGAEGLPEADKVMAIANDETDMAKKISDVYSMEAIAEKYIKVFPEYVETYFSQPVIEKIIKRDFIQ